MPRRLVVPLRLRMRVLAIVRSRILGAIVEFFDVDPTDDIEMTQWQELTDRIMAALFRR